MPKTNINIAVSLSAAVNQDHFSSAACTCCFQVVPASNPVFSTVLLSLTEVLHWSSQGLGKSNGGQLECFDEPDSEAVVGSC